MLVMTAGNKHQHLILSWTLVIAFLVAIATGSFAMVGLLAPVKHRSEAKVVLAYSQNDVWQAMLDVETRAQIQNGWSNLQVITRDQYGPSQWEADTNFGSRKLFKRTSTQPQSTIIIEANSYERNMKITTEYRIEVLGAESSRVVINQQQQTPGWYDRSLLMLHGINYEIKDTISYLKEYFET